MFPTKEVSADTVDSLLFAVVVLGVLLVAGVLLRLAIPSLRRFFIPAALIGGAIGAALGPHGAGLFPEGMVATWETLPNILITVVFAPMLLGMRLPKARQTYHLIAPQLCFGYMGVLLLVGLPLLLSALLLGPVWGVNDMFATIVEVSWPGGHGTAGGMGEVYDELGWSDGGPLSLASATAGLVFGILMGMALINIGARRGHLRHLAAGSTRTANPTARSADATGTDGTGAEATGADAGEGDIVPGERRASVGKVTLNKDLVDNLAFHGSLIAVAILIGWVMQYALEFAIPGMPLFPLAMIGGGLVQAAIARTRLGDAVDRGSLGAIQGLALDVLVVAAVASIAVPVVMDNIVPLTLLMLLAATVSVLFFYWAGPRLFRQDWFEHAIVNFGTMTGVASVGLMLLRSADPGFKTDAATAYALRAPFFSPILGGGLVTALLPTLTDSYGALGVGLCALALTALIYLFARLTGLWQRKDTVEPAPTGRR